VTDEPNAIGELRLATWPAHQRLEKRIDFKARLATALSYRGHLERMWGFYAALEPRLGSGVLAGVLRDYDTRRKLPLLTRDLLDLGLRPELLTRLPRCESVPACEEAAAAFGCAYVLEGATLGGRSLMPLVQTRLGLTADRGATFLASYGEAVGDMWRTFGSALNHHCRDRAQRDRANGAAVATFVALEDWLCGTMA